MITRVSFLGMIRDLSDILLDGQGARRILDDKMNALIKLLTSSVGKKILMALTGIVLFAFVVVHMAGNLQIFAGPDVLNEYAEFLKKKAAVLWGFRLGMLAVVTIHIVVSVQLALSNAAARPEEYFKAKAYGASYASRTMIWSGLIILAFIIYHLLHFTVGAIDPSYMDLRDEAGRFDVYQMMIQGFSNPLVSFFYILSIGLLCFHLSHGVSALFMSLGIRNATWRRCIEITAIVVAFLIFLGYSSIPIAVMTGIVK